MGSGGLRRAALEWPVLILRLGLESEVRFLRQEFSFKKWPWFSYSLKYILSVKVTGF